ncbi:MAG: hypothetical protein KF878_29180 [Planctomycetes bacterium]|nr:hypothetical protein [Planctomycetota bacterium]
MSHHTYRAPALTTTLAALLLAPAALAQEPLRPSDPLAGPRGDGPAIRDIGGWLGEDEPLPGAAGAAHAAGPPAPAVGGGEDPLAAPAAPAAEDPEKARQEARRRDRQINRNYQQAIDIYEDLDAPDHQIAALDRRIANNERLVADFRRRLAEGQQQRRNMQVDLFNRTFFLRQQRERGQITQEVFDKLIRQEERKYEEDSAGLKANLEAWHKECKQAEARLEAMKAERRMLEASQPRATRRNQQQRAGGAPVPAPKPGERLLGTLEERLRQLERFNTRSTMEGVHPRDVGVGSVESVQLKND